MSAVITAAVTAVVGVASAAYSANRQRKAQKQAMAQQQQAAAQQEKLAQQSLNRQNSTKANAALSLAQAQRQQDGVGSTMLTGATGISNDKLKLGKTTLLGG